MESDDAGKEGGCGSYGSLLFVPFWSSTCLLLSLWTTLTISHVIGPFLDLIISQNLFISGLNMIRMLRDSSSMLTL